MCSATWYNILEYSHLRVQLHEMRRRKKLGSEDRILILLLTHGFGATQTYSKSRSHGISAPLTRVHGSHEIQGVLVLFFFENSVLIAFVWFVPGLFHYDWYNNISYLSNVISSDFSKWEQTLEFLQNRFSHEDLTNTMVGSAMARYSLVEVSIGGARLGLA